MVRGMGFLSLVCTRGFPGLRTLPRQPGVIPNSRHSLSGSLCWNAAHQDITAAVPPGPTTLRQSCHSSEMYCFPLSGSWHLSQCCISHLCHLRKLPMLPWHHAVLQSRSTGAFSSDTSKTPSFFRNKSMSVHAFMQWPTEWIQTASSQVLKSLGVAVSVLELCSRKSVEGWERLM